MLQAPASVSLTLYRVSNFTWSVGRVAKRQKEEVKVDTNKLEGGAAVEQPEVEAEDIKVEVSAGPDIKGELA